MDRTAFDEFFRTKQRTRGYKDATMVAKLMSTASQREELAVPADSEFPFATRRRQDGQEFLVEIDPTVSESEGSAVRCCIGNALKP